MNFKEIRLVGVALFHAERRDEINNVIVTNIFRTHLNLNDNIAKNKQKQMSSE